MKKILLLAAICGSILAEQTYELNVPNMKRRLRQENRRCRKKRQRRKKSEF